MTSSELISDPKRINRAIGYACRILGMREYSEKMLRQKILLKGYEAAEVEQVIIFLKDNNWLSDKRFCEVFVRSKTNRGQGLTRIRYELREKGVPDNLLQEILTEHPVNWQDVCDETAERKIDSANLQNNIKDRLRIERFLRYRGFSAEEVRRSMNKYINNKIKLGVNLGEYDE